MESFSTVITQFLIPPGLFHSESPKRENFNINYDFFAQILDSLTSFKFRRISGFELVAVFAEPMRNTFVIYQNEWISANTKRMKLAPYEKLINGLVELKFVHFRRN